MTDKPKAGRPKSNKPTVKPMQITLYPEQITKLKQLGGSEWIRKQLDKVKQSSSSV